MQKDDAKKIEVLNSPKYLRFSAALSYKAGLDRNDKILLDIIDSRTQEKMIEYFGNYGEKSIESLQIDSGLLEYNQDIEKSVRQKNKSEVKDNLQDKKYLSYDEDDQRIQDEEEYDDIIELVTLNSDIIRNTREVSNNDKKRCLSNNISAYLGLMWYGAESFKDIINTVDKDGLRKLLLIKSTSKKEIDVDVLLRRIRQIILQIIPISIIDYMSEHLSNPKLKLPVSELINTESDINKKLYYVLLLFKIDVNTAIIETKKLINSSKLYVIDHIIFLYIYFFCFHNKLNDTVLEQLIALMNKIRSKYPVKDKKYPVGDTFSSDIKKNILTQKLK
jgi:hypothetical protein